MKKLRTSLLILMGFFIVSCDKQNIPYRFLAQQAGFYSVLGWFSMDNPDAEIKDAARSVIDIIRKTSEYRINTDEQYSQILFEPVMTMIDGKFKPNQIPLIKSGAMVILSGVDLFFISNPNIRANEKLTLEIIESFCDGALNAIESQIQEPAMQVVNRSIQFRMKLSLIQQR